MREIHKPYIQHACESIAEGVSILRVEATLCLTKLLTKEVSIMVKGPNTQESFEEELVAQSESLEALQAEAVVSLNYRCISCFDMFTEVELGNEMDRCPTCGEQDTIAEV